MIVMSLVIISFEQLKLKYGIYFSGIILGIGFMVLPNYPPGYFLALLFFSGVLKDVSNKNT
jgi:hypothetical protein